MLKLTGDFEYVPCPRCNGRGWIRCEPTFGNPNGPNRDKYQVSTGKKIPCPNCLGKKVRLKDGQEDRPENLFPNAR